MTEPLPDALKLLNQRLLSHGCLSIDDVKHIWTTDLANHDKGDYVTLQKALKASSIQLSTIGLEIRGISMNNTTYYAIINKQNDQLSKTGFHGAFTTTEINYIRLILEKLVEEESVTRANLVNAKNSLKDQDALTLDAATKILHRLVEDHWLQTEDGAKKRLTNATSLKLAPRAYLELSYMLVEQFGVEKADLPQQIYF